MPSLDSKADGTLKSIGNSFVPIVDPELTDFCALPPDYAMYPKLYVFGEARKLDQSMLVLLEALGLTEIQLLAKRSRRVYYNDRLDDFIDICIDGSFRNRNWAGGRGGYGGVFFNSDGKIIAVFWGRSLRLKDNNFHEVEAVDLAMQYAEELQLPKIRIRCDNQSMCNEIFNKLEQKETGNNGFQDVERRSATRNTIKHIVELRERNWPGRNFEILQIPRECNYSADFLSRVEKVGGGHRHRVTNEDDPFSGLAFGESLALLVARTVQGYFLKFWGAYAFLKEKRDAVAAAAGRLLR